MIFVFIILNVCIIGLCLWSRSVLIKFVENNQSISSPAILDEYKRAVRWNMYGALIVIVCGVVSIAYGFYLSNQYGLLGLVVVVSINIPAFLIGVSTKKAEQRSRDLECELSLRSEYQKVSEVWVKKALPDF